MLKSVGYCLVDPENKYRPFSIVVPKRDVLKTQADILEAVEYYLDTPVKIDGCFANLFNKRTKIVEFHVEIEEDHEGRTIYPFQIREIPLY